MPESRARFLVVEDEYLIRILVEDMLSALVYDVAAAVGTFAEASAQAAKGEFDAAILDINLDGRDTYPVADILAKRGVPFVFVTGYGGGPLAPPHTHHLGLPTT